MEEKTRCSFWGVVLTEELSTILWDLSWSTGACCSLQLLQVSKKFICLYTFITCNTKEGLSEGNTYSCTSLQPFLWDYISEIFELRIIFYWLYVYLEILDETTTLCVCIDSKKAESRFPIIINLPLRTNSCEYYNANWSFEISIILTP